jgi:hypothetical protein
VGLLALPLRLLVLSVVGEFGGAVEKLAMGMPSEHAALFRRGAAALDDRRGIGEVVGGDRGTR